VLWQSALSVASKLPKRQIPHGGPSIAMFAETNLLRGTRRNA
jgi:hypothetical protein